MKKKEVIVCTLMIIFMIIISGILVERYGVKLSTDRTVEFTVKG